MKKRLLSKQTKELRALGYTGGDRIADLIEFLGDDMMTIDLLEDNFFSVETMPMIAEETFTLFEKSNLCDALWEACVYKLKQ